jgi:dipeptidyl-peptidase-4
MKMTKYLAILILIAFFDIANSQVAIDSSVITLERIYKTGDFSQEWFGPYQWYQNGKYYTKLERSKTIKGGLDIVKYNTGTNKKELLVAAEDLFPKDTNKPLSIENYFWSHDLDKLLIFTNSLRVWRSNTKGDYWVFDMQTKELFQLGKNLPNSSLMFAKFSNDDTKIAFVCKNNIYVENLKTKNITQLTFDGNEDIINGTFDWVYEEEMKCRDGFRWSNDDKYIAFWQVDASGIRDFYMINNTDSVYSKIIPVQYPKTGYDPSSVKTGVINIQNKSINWIPVPGDTKQNYLPRLQWLEDENKIVLQQLNRRQNTLKLWLYDVNNKSIDNFFIDKDKAWIDIDWSDVSQTKWEPTDVIFFNDNKNFLWVSEKDGWRHIYNIDVASGNESLITKGQYDIASLYGYDKKNKIIYLNASPDNSTERYLYSIDLDGKTLKRLTPENFKGVNLYSISPDFNFAIQSFSSVDHIPIKNMVSIPDHKVLTNLVKNDKLKNIVSKLKLGKREFFNITTADKIEMDGYIIFPPDFDPAKKYPVLFYVYGEPWGQTALNRWPGIWHLMLSQKEMIIITMDNRGTPCLKGREWRKSIYRKVGVINSRDQAMAAKEILKKKFIDTSKVAVWGWSGGGSMTLNLLFRYPEIYKTGISVAPVTNLLYYDNVYEERYMGLPQENQEDYIQGSPVNFARNLQGNLLLIHGTGDDNVHYQNTEALINELIKYNKQFKLMSYPNRTHGIYEGKGTRYHLYTMMTNYLMEKLR